MVAMGPRKCVPLAVVAVTLAFAACGGKPSGGGSQPRTASTASSPAQPAASPGWILRTLPTRTRDGSLRLAFTDERSAVVLGGGRLAKLRLGVGIVDAGAAPADVIDGPVAAGPGRAALLVMRPASGGRAQLTVVVVTAEGSTSAVLPVAMVPGPRVDHALLRASRAGELAVVWQELGGDQVFLATSPPDGAFGLPVAVAPARFDAPDPELALEVGPAGHLVVISNGPRGTLSARVRPPGGALGPPETVGPTHGADDIAVDVDANGDLLVAWSTMTAGEEAEEGPEDDFNNRVAVYAARREARRGRFTAPRRLFSSDPESDEGLPDVAAAFDAMGLATVAFTAVRAGRGPEPLLAFTAARRQPFGAPQRLTAGTDLEPGVDLAAGSDGRMLLATRRNVRILAGFRASGARRFGPLEPLARLAVAEEPVAAFAPGARAAVVGWLGSTLGRRERRPAITVAVHR